MMTNDEHVMETFGPISDDTMDWDNQEVYRESHYYDTLRNFEELIAEYGVKRVYEDLDDYAQEQLWRLNNGQTLDAD